MHGFTYSGHPVGGALGLVNIDIMEREGLVQQSAEVGGYLQKLLADRVGAHPYVGEVRGMGQMIAVEFVADKTARPLLRPEGGRAPRGCRQGARARRVDAGAAVHRGQLLLAAAVHDALARPRRRSSATARRSMP